MIRLSTYIKIVKTWLTLYSYWAISKLFEAYPKRNETVEFYFYISCLFVGTALGLIVCGIMTWFDFQMEFAPPISSLETSNLPTNLSIEELNIQKHKELEEFQKEAEGARDDLYLWWATTIVVYCLVFSICS